MDPTANLLSASKETKYSEWDWDCPDLRYEFRARERLGAESNWESWNAPPAILMVGP